MARKTHLEIEVMEKPKLRLTDDGTDDLCLEFTGKAFRGDVDPVYTGKVKVYIQKRLLEGKNKRNGLKTKRKVII